MTPRLSTQFRDPSGTTKRRGSACFVLSPQIHFGTVLSVPITPTIVSITSRDIESLFFSPMNFHFIDLFSKHTRKYALELNTEIEKTWGIVHENRKVFVPGVFFNRTFS